MKIKHLFRWIIFFGFFFSFVFGRHLDFRNYNVQDGLIQSQVFSIVQDNEGFIWFGTAGGLSRFDGKEFQRFTKRNGLAENYILSALKDNDGFLWFGHGGGKLSRWNPQKKAFDTFLITIDEKPENKVNILDLFQDSTGRIWILTLGQGVFYLQDGKFHHVDERNGLLSKYVYGIVQLQDSSIWIATARGISVIPDPDSIPAKLDSLAIPDYKNPYVISMAKDNDGGVWMSIADEGLYYYRSNGKMDHFTKKDGLLSNNVWEIYQDHEGGIWFVYYQRGVSYLSPENRKKSKFVLEHFTEKEGLTSNDVNTIYEDNEGNIWIGLNGKGVEQLRDRAIEYYLADKKLPEKIIWSIWVKNGEYWFGSNKGIIRYNPDTRKYKLIDKIGGKPLESVMQIFEDNKGNLWFAVFGTGIFKYDRRTKKITEFKIPKDFAPYDIFTINQDNEGKYWFGFLQYGILVYDPVKNKFKAYNRENNKIVSDSISVIYKDCSGKLWIGTSNAGLLMYDGEKFHLYSPETGYSVLGVTNITEDRQGNIWLITNSDELLMFDGKQVRDFTSTSGLDQEALYSLAFWNDELWVGTNRGLARLDRAARTFVHFGLQQGFPISETNERAVYIDPDSNLWFGTIQGVVKINPANLKNFQFVPPVKITGIKIFLKNAKLPENRELAYNRNHLTISFTGLFYKVPEWIQYQYKLEGFDPDWSPPVRERFTTYSYLPPGEYTFKVRASVDGEHWSETPAQLYFIIRPPFYKTWWFVSLSILISMLAIFLTIYYRDVKNKQIQRMLEEKVKERTLELQKEKETVERINQALTESEAKFRTLTEISPSGIFIYQDFRFVYVNPATEAISGYKKEELLNHSILDIVHPDYRELVSSRARQRMEGKDVPHRYEFKVLTKNGEERWVDFSARAINYDGKMAGLGTVFDITERKNAEEELMAEKERLSATLGAITDGVIATDENKKIIFCNRRATKMLGIGFTKNTNFDEYTFNQLFTLADEKDGSPVKNPVDELLSTKGSIQIERTAFLINQEDKRILIEYSAAPILDKNSELIGAVIAFRDITDKRRMEKELLKNQKLESIGVLAGGIAHDFNNFLTAIMGNLSLIRMRAEEDGKLLQRIQSAEKAANRAQELTQQLLTFSKGGSPVKKHTDLVELVKDSADFVLSGSNVNYTLEVDSDIWNADVDAGQISQVIQNLIINADQAMPNGGTIRVKMENYVHDKKNSLPLKKGKFVKLTVKDEGIGIPQKYLARIFDPFFTTKQSGSGLGLATSFSIITKHEGHIELQSEVGKGTEFIIYLPASEVAPAEKIQRTIVSDSHKRKKSGLVLVMDDEEMIREIATELLSQFGFLTIHANDGNQALVLYKKLKSDGKKIDLVIMDLTIPGGMGGKEAIVELLKIDPEANAIVSSGYSNDPVMAQYREYGFMGCLKKPFKLEELKEILDELGLI